MLLRLKSLALTLLFVGALCSPAFGSQGSGCMPTTGTVSGLSLVTDINAGFAALISSNSGSSAPVTDCSGLSIAGQFWLDTSTSPPTLKNYDGTSWLTLGRVDTTNHVWVPPIGGGTNTVASATTTDLCSVPQGYVTISGSVTITGFGSSCIAGQIKYLNFTGTPLITYNATSLIVPGAASITAVAGDQAVAAYLGSGNWRLVSYTPISGQSVSNPSVPAGFVSFGVNSTAPSGFALAYGQDFSRATFAALLAASTVAQNGTRASGNPIITSLTDTSQFRTGQKVEGTGIPGGTTILTVDSGTQVTLSANATSSGTSTVTTFFFGNGDGSTTFTGPNCNGVVLAGRGNMGGSDRNLLNATYFGASGTGVGSFGGVQSRSFTVAQDNLPNVNFFGTAAVTINNILIKYSTSNFAAGVNPAVTGINTGLSNTGNTGTVQSDSGASTVASGGSGTAITIASVQPTLILNCFVKTTN